MNMKKPVLVFGLLVGAFMVALVLGSVVGGHT